MKRKEKLLGLFMVLFTMISVNAWGHGTHNGKVTVTASAGGTVYISTSKDATSGNDVETWNCGGNSSGDSKTYYLFAKPEPGYKFTGWTGDETSTDNPYKVDINANSNNNNKTYKANFTPNTYTITFDASGGTIPDGGNMSKKIEGLPTSLNDDKKSGSVTVVYDASSFRDMSDDIPEKEGYKFAGWFAENGDQVYGADGVAVSNETYWKDAPTEDNQNYRLWQYDGDVTLYAHWEERVNMTIGSAHYGTFCAPFDVVIPADVTAYKETSDEGNYVKFSSIDGVIPAKTPVIVYSESPVNQDFYGTPRTSDKCGDGVMKGNLGNDINATKGSYVLNSSSTEKLGVAFKVVGDTPRKVAKNRCYIPASSSPAKLNSLSIVIDETTVITDFSAIITPEINAIYSVSGAKLDKMQKGMNVVKYSDGSVKKIFVK